VVYVADTEKGRAAARTLERDYKSYVARVAAGEPDLFAAYPLWIDLKYVKSEIDFLATQSGQQVGAPATTPVAPAPSGPVEVVTLPPSAVPVSEDDLREQLAEVGSDHPLARYTGIFSENGQLR